MCIVSVRVTESPETMRKHIYALEKSLKSLTNLLGRLRKEDEPKYYALIKIHVEADVAALSIMKQVQAHLDAN